MSSDDKFKYIYALTLLFLTFLWAAFCVWITYRAMIDGEPVDILGSAGANMLLGAISTWDALVVQHYFRRAKPE